MTDAAMRIDGARLMTASAPITTELPLLSEVGGKGQSLLRMDMAGLPVPPRFILNTAFFTAWTEQLKCLPEWDRLQAALRASGDIDNATHALKAVCRELPLTSEQERQLDEGLRQLGEDAVVAVRSSSPEEDLSGASFAGGYETTLGVTAATLADAVRTSFTSAFDARVFVYKQQHGFCVDNPQIAVVVQKQIAAHIAGVGFSLNPITNDFDEAVIDANWGLGETVVSGQVSPDHYVVDKVGLTVVTCQLGEKQTSIWSQPGGGTTERPEARAGEFCLTNVQLLELTELISAVEELYGQPVDIEWAYEGGQLHLLQARPVTTAIPLPPQMTTRPGERRTLYLDAALTEGVTTNRPMAPLTLHWLFDTMSIVATEFVGPTRMPADADPQHSLLFAAGGRYYFNLSHLMSVISPTTFARQMEIADVLLGRMLAEIDRDHYRAQPTPQYLRVPSLLRRLPRALWHAWPFAVQTITAARHPEEYRRRHDRWVARTVNELAAPVDPDTPLAELLDRHGRMMSRAWSHVSIPALVAYLFYQGRLGKIFAHGTADEQQLLDAIMMGLPGNEAVELGLRLYEMSQLLDPQDFADLDRLADRLQAGDLPVEFHRRWSDFVTRYGFRGPGELKLTSPRYGEDPRLALEQMSYMVDSAVDPASSQRRHIHERERAYDQLRAQLRGRRLRRFEDAYAVFSHLASTRDTPKYLMVLGNGAFRRHALVIAESLVQQDRLDAVEDVFDLTVELRRIREARRPFYDQVERVQSFPHLIDSRGRIAHLDTDEEEPGVFTGLGISRGVATGRVKVLHTARDKPVEKGDVLVAYTTDPGWTPLFVNAEAIILEVGGMLQHGGVVAREYGKPCVAGIQGITAALEDGQQVRVDGSSGVVQVLPDNLPDHSATPMKTSS